MDAWIYEQIGKRITQLKSSSVIVIPDILTNLFFRIVSFQRFRRIPSFPNIDNPSYNIIPIFYIQ